MQELHDLTEQKQRAAELLRSGDYKRSEVAEQVGVDPATIWRWRQKHEVLEEAAKEGDRTQYTKVVDAWIQRLVDGEHSASEMIFYLKNKSRILEGVTWRDKTEIEHSGEVEVDHSSLEISVVDRRGEED